MVEGNRFCKPCDGNSRCVRICPHPGKPHRPVQPLPRQLPAFGRRMAACNRGDHLLLQQWSVMERIHTSNACHFFTACRAVRSLHTCMIDFGSEGAFDHIPAFRYGCRLEGNVLLRQSWSTELDPMRRAHFKTVDGKRRMMENHCRP